MDFRESTALLPEQGSSELTAPDKPRVGIEWTDHLEQEIVAHLGRFECFELIPENFFHRQRRHVLEKVGQSGVPVLVHAVELSVGSDEPLKEKHLEHVLRVADQVNAVNLSDHLCFTEAGGVEIGQLTPLVYTQRAVDVVSRKIDRIRARTKLPFLIENIANRFVVPGSEMTETEFISAVLKKTGCGLLLDLHNLHANAENFGFDPFEWMSRLDLEATGAVHLAGGYYDADNYLVDSHSQPVPDRAWALYRRLLEATTPAFTIVERTDDVPPFAELLEEAETARRLVRDAKSRIGRPARVGLEVPVDGRGMEVRP